MLFTASASVPHTHTSPRMIGAPYLFPRHRVLHQHQVCELGKCAEGVEISQLGNVVRCQDESGEIRYRLRDGGLDLGDAVAGEEEGGEAGREGEVA